MDLDKLQELIRIFQDSGLSEIEIEEEGLCIRLKKNSPVTGVNTETLLLASHPLQQQPMSVAPGALSAAPGGTANGVQEKDSGTITINSPMVGTFYASPSPGEAPFAKAGDEVSEGQTICIVEAMKLMNEVPAKFACVVEKVLVQNGEPVEYDQPLFCVRRLQ